MFFHWNINDAIWSNNSIERSEQKLKENTKRNARKMTTKNILQVKVITEDTSEKLQASTNNFLVERKLTRSDLISMHYCRGENGKSITVVYEVNMEEK